MAQDPNDLLAAVARHTAEVVAQDAFQPGQYDDQALSAFVIAAARLLSQASARALDARSALDEKVQQALERMPADFDSSALRATQDDPDDMSNRLGLAARVETYATLATAVERLSGGEADALVEWAKRWAPFFAGEAPPEPPGTV